MRAKFLSGLSDGVYNSLQMQIIGLWTFPLFCFFFFAVEALPFSALTRNCMVAVGAPSISSIIKQFGLASWTETDLS